MSGNVTTEALVNEILTAALSRIVALDFAKTVDGHDDFYSGPDRFVRAWLIAKEAMIRSREMETR